jgi:hypothetical protein
LGREISGSQWKGTACTHECSSFFLFDGAGGEGYFEIMFLNE